MSGKVLFYPLWRIETPSMRACFLANNRNRLYARIYKVTIKLPKKIEFSLEYEVGDEKTELEVEFGWPNKKKSRKGKFEVFKSADEQWCFHLKAPNNEIILVSEEYQKEQGALGGIETVRKNAQLEQFEVRESRAGQPYFVLKAKNNQIVGTSQMYKRQEGCNKGIKSVIKFAPEAEESLVEEA